jgi:NADH-quinone oxidoreductase subunit N
MNAIIISAVWGVIMMLTGLVKDNRTLGRNMAIAGGGLLVLANLLELQNTRLFSFDLSGMLKITEFGLVFNLLVSVCILLYFLVSASDFQKSGKDVPEYFALIFFILCGAALATSFTNLLILFLAIEIISIPTYILAGIEKNNLRSNEASMKYFLMGCFSTGVMLMGIALIYGSAGSFYLPDIAAKVTEMKPMFSIGLMLMLISMAFKVSVVPFHFWTPDVYDGAPTVVTSFMATIVKIAAFAAFYLLFKEGFGHLSAHWLLYAAILTALTLLVGNITAVFQQSVKRMLAYSSIAQAGFMMFAIVALNPTGKEGLLIYAVGYSLATIGVFSVLAKLKDHSFEGLNGLASRHPVIAAAVAVCMLSLAGIPGTVGFMAKFYMLSAAVKAGGLLWLVITGIVCAAISVYYYFKVIQAMYFKQGEVQEFQYSGGFKISLLVITVLIVLLGIFPGLVTGLLNYFLL